MSHAQSEDFRLTIPAGLSAKEVLEAIAEQTNLDYSFPSNSFDENQRIEWSVNDMPLSDILKQFGASIGLDCSLLGEQIVLSIPIAKTDEPTTISGFITDQKTGENLIGATVSVSGTPLGTVSNAFGFYSLRLPKGPHTLQYSYLGYEKKEQQIQLNQATQKSIQLAVASIDLPDVVITQASQGLSSQQGLGKVGLQPKTLESMPEFGGENGLVKGLQMLPGIQMHSDGSAYFYVRGGGRDQNVIFIDDAPIYNPAHLFGFYSLVIPDFAQSIEVYKSDIPVQLGDRIASVVDIRTKDGNLNKVSFSGALNPIINRLALELPISRGKGSAFLSYRRSNYEWIYRSTSPDARLGFLDLSLKANYKVNNRNRVFFTLITARDQFLDENNSGIEWANVSASLRWNHLFGPRLFSNTVLHTGNYAFRLDFGGNSWNSRISSLTLKSDFTYYINPLRQVRFGGELTGYGFNPGSISQGELLEFTPSISENTASKGALYAQYTQNIQQRWQWNISARLTNWSNLGPQEYFTYGSEGEVLDTINAPEGAYHNYVNLSPRMSLLYRISDSEGLKLSIGRYHQYLHLISNSESPFTALEVWLPSSPTIRPQRADQIALDYYRSIGKGLSLETSVYYKWLGRQIDYAPHPETLLNPFLEGELRFGRGYAYGIETSLNKSIGKLTGQLHYTYARSFRQTIGVNAGETYPAFQDRPHHLALLLQYQRSRRWLWSAYYTLFSGATFSSPTGFYQFNQQTIPVYEERNNDRLPTYRRLDLACRWNLNKNPEAKFQHSLTLSIYNFLAHPNAISINSNKIIGQDGEPAVPVNTLVENNLINTRIDLIRFFPSLTYKFKL